MSRTYSVEDKAVWSELFGRQYLAIQKQTPPEYSKGIEYLGLSGDHIPQISDLNTSLAKATGFRIIEVDEVSKPAEFFRYLADRKFPVRSHVRPRREIDSVDWPDLFHEVFGHAPFLTDPNYADFLEKFGRIGVGLSKGLWWQLFRLSWYTIEFGVISRGEAKQLYGAGILSAIAEVKFINTDGPSIEPFDLITALRTPYEISFPQPKLFALDSFSDLGNLIDDTIVEKLECAKRFGDIATTN